MDAYIADPLEYRFVDQVKLVGAEAFGKKVVSLQEWYFSKVDARTSGMPSAFLMEAIMQTGVFTVTVENPVDNRLMMFQACKDLEIFGIAWPGEVLHTQVQLKSYRHGVANLAGSVWENNRCLGRMTFVLVAPSELAKYSRP